MTSSVWVAGVYINTTDANTLFQEDSNSLQGSGVVTDLHYFPIKGLVGKAGYGRYMGVGYSMAVNE